MVRIFGFEIDRPDQGNIEERLKTFTPPQQDDGAITVQSGSYYGTYVDLDGNGNLRNEIDLINRYREMAIQPELDDAINDIVDDAIIFNDDGETVKIVLDKLDQPQNIKKKIEAEFATALKLLGFSDQGHDIFRQWYVDGRLFYHVVIDEKNPSSGIQELRFIDPRRIRKYRELQRVKDPDSGMVIIKKMKEYYLYNEIGYMGVYGAIGQKIAVDSIININSGLLDSKRKSVISYLHKAIRPLNQLRMMEDATVIYKVARSPERRVFYIDVGNMPTQRADQYVRDIMVKYKNKLVYDSSTGEIRDDRKFMSMLEDFWLPRREGNRASSIETLPGTQLGSIEDLEYFEKRLYRALNIPYSRSQPETGFSLGRTTEINRDEVKFAKFIDRLRNKFAILFDEILKINLVLKGICTEDEWFEFREYIFYDFLKDNNFNELKETDLLNNRLATLTTIDPYVGKYYSKKWVQKNVLKLRDDQIEEMEEEIQEEGEEAAQGLQTDALGNVIQTDNYGNPAPGTGGISPDQAQMMQDQQDKKSEEPKGDSYGANDNEAAREARSLGLQYYGFGRYGKKGKTTHISKNGKLVLKGKTTENRNKGDNK